MSKNDQSDDRRVGETRVNDFLRFLMFLSSIVGDFQPPFLWRIVADLWRIVADLIIIHVFLWRIN